MFAASRLKTTPGKRWHCLLLLALAGCAAPRAALWDVVDRHCLQQAGDNWVCPKHATNYVLLKTYQTPPHYLLIPTVKISGIEAEAFWKSGPDNYFRAAWQERGYAAAHLGGGVAEERVGIAINSRFGRSQDQLHVHLACVNARAVAELAQSGLGESWSEIRLHSLGQVFHARRLAGNELPEDVLDDVLRHYPQLAQHREQQTLFAASVNFADVGPRAVLLEGEYRANDAAYPGHAESLLSPNCS